MRQQFIENNVKHQNTFRTNTIKASTFDGLESRRSSRSWMIFTLAGASSEPERNLKMRTRIWGRKKWELCPLLLCLLTWLCFCKTCTKETYSEKFHSAFVCVFILPILCYKHLFGTSPTKKNIKQGGTQIICLWKPEQSVSHCWENWQQPWTNFLMVFWKRSGSSNSKIKKSRPLLLWWKPDQKSSKELQAKQSNGLKFPMNKKTKREKI